MQNDSQKKDPLQNDNQIEDPYKEYYGHVTSSTERYLKSEDRSTELTEEQKTYLGYYKFFGVKWAILKIL